MPHRAKLRAQGTTRFVALVLAAVALLPACGDDDSADPDRTTTTVDNGGDTGGTTSSSSSSSTSSTTTTAAEPATDEESIEELLEEFETFWSRAGNPPDPSSPLIGQLLADPLRTRVAEGFQGEAAAGYHWEGTFAIEVDEIAVDGDEAVARTCALDGTTGYDADGAVDSPPADAPVTHAFSVRRTSDGWRITGFMALEDSPCELP